MWMICESNVNEMWKYVNEMWMKCESMWMKCESNVNVMCFPVDTRLHDFVVYTSTYMPQQSQPSLGSDEAGAEVCAVYPGTARKAAITTLFCGRQMSGRYVVIQIPGDSESLALCEVEIYSELYWMLWIYSFTMRPYI